MALSTAAVLNVAADGLSIEQEEEVGQRKFSTKYILAGSLAVNAKEPIQS